MSRKNLQQKAYWQMHLSVLLFGLTAILGALIDLSAFILVWWRLLLTCAALLLIVNWRSLWHRIERTYLWQFMLIGVLVGLHWVSFFAAIKLANASIALVCLATAPLFTAVLEPLFTAKSYRRSEFIFATLLMPGMILVVNGVSVEQQLGVWVGLFSAFLVSVFLVLGKRIAHVTDAMSITLIELASAWVFLSLLLPLYFLWWAPESSFLPQSSDWIYLAILAFACTAFAYSLAQQALKTLTAFTINLTTNLEPLYGIALAIWILNEHHELTFEFYLGVAIILATVLLYPVVNKPSAQRVTIT